MLAQELRSATSVETALDMHACRRTSRVKWVQEQSRAVGERLRLLSRAAMPPCATGGTSCFTIASVHWLHRHSGSVPCSGSDPLFWATHLALGLPPGTDHVHRVVFLFLALLGLALPNREIFPPRRACGARATHAVPATRVSPSHHPPPYQPPRWGARVPPFAGNCRTTFAACAVTPEARWRSHTWAAAPRLRPGPRSDGNVLPAGRRAAGRLRPMHQLHEPTGSSEPRPSGANGSLHSFTSESPAPLARHLGRYAPSCKLPLPGRLRLAIPGFWDCEAQSTR